MTRRSSADVITGRRHPRRRDSWVAAIAGVVAAGALVACANEPPPDAPLLGSLPLSATVEQDGVKVTIAIDASPLAVGTSHKAGVRIENVGPDDAIYATNDCGLAARVSYRPRGDWNSVGVRQLGVAAAFKQLALRGDEASGNGARSSLTPALFVGVESWGCRDIRLVRHLEPGAALEERMQWDAWPGTPAGPIELVAAFAFIGREGDPGVARDRGIEVRLPSAIVGDGGNDPVGPVGAVDAAVADEAFAAFLASSPPDAWNNATLDLDANGRYWRVGLSVDRGPFAPQAYGEVLVDRRSGQVVVRRFDPPAL